MGALQSIFILPPIDGLNLIADPQNFGEREARRLDDYYIYDWGIRERVGGTLIDVTDGNPVISMYSFASAANYGTFVATTANLYRWASPSTFTLIDATATIGYMFGYKKNVFFCNPETDAIGAYDLTTDTYSATSFTGGGTDDPVYGFVYRNRVYVLYHSKSYFRYGGAGSISGALSSTYDLGEFFQKPAQKLVWGASWSYNQGINNDALFVVGNEAGEVFIYAGDYPGAPNWFLVTRCDIPAPLLAQHTATTQVPTVIAVGQDILVSTTRGVISLREILAGNRGTGATDYYNVSRKIGYEIQSGIGDKSALYPFAYFNGGTSSRDVYVLNYERGAWSKFPDIAPSSVTVNAISCSAVPLTGATGANPTTYVLFGLSNGKLHRVNESGSAGPESCAFKWYTPYLNLGSETQKTLKFVRIIARDIRGNGVQINISTSFDFNDSKTGNQDSVTYTTLGGEGTGYIQQEMAPNGVGHHLSFLFAKTNFASFMNELAGFHAYFESGPSVY